LQNPKLTEDEQQELKNDLSKEELLNVLKGLQKNKTPGEDGLAKIYDTSSKSIDRGSLGENCTGTLQQSNYSQ